MGGQQTRTTIFFCAEIGNLLLIRPSSHSCATAAITSTGGFAVGSRAIKIPVVLVTGKVGLVSCSRFLAFLRGEGVVACSDCLVVMRGVVDSERVAVWCRSTVELEMFVFRSGSSLDGHPDN